MSVTIYGASDDLIEIEGDVREEFNSALTDTDEGALLVFSDGTILRIRYTEQGVWRISPVISAGGLAITPAPEHDDDNYSDRATIPNDVWWVVLGQEMSK